MPGRYRPVMVTTQLPGSVRRGYALGGVATGSFGTVPGLLLLPYLTDRLGVAAGLAGLVVFLPKAWDVILNPIAGRISDRSTNPGGRRRPFLLRAGLALAISFALLFMGPTSPTGLGAAWVVVLFLACATAYAFFQVPYVAMPAELTDDYDERTRLMSWRVAILALAILVSGGLSPMVRDALGQEWGYRGVGVFVGLLIALGALGAWWGTRAAPMRDVAASTASLGEQLRIVARAKDFRTLLMAYVLQALATAAMLAGVDYVARARMGSPGLSSILFVCFVAPALVVTPLWQRVGTGSASAPAFSSHRSRSAPERWQPCSACGWAAPRSPPPWRSSASGMPAPRCSRSRCSRTSRPWMQPAPERTAPASTPVCGLLRRPSAWRWAPSRMRVYSLRGAMSPRPTGWLTNRSRP